MFQVLSSELFLQSLELYLKLQETEKKKEKKKKKTPRKPKNNGFSKSRADRLSDCQRDDDLGELLWVKLSTGKKFLEKLVFIEINYHRGTISSKKK